MYFCDGLPPTKERAIELRKIAERFGVAKIARCKVCQKEKQFSHMGFFELKNFWDFKLNKKSYKYIGICENCLITPLNPNGVEIKDA